MLDVIFPHKRMCFPPVLSFSFIFFFSFLSGIKQTFNRSVNFGSNSSAQKTQFSFPQLLRLSLRNSLLLLQISNFLESPTKEPHLLVEKGSLQLLAWTVSSKSYLHKEYQKNLPLLSQMLEDQVESFIAIRPGLSVIAGAMGDKLIQLYVL